MTEQQLQAEFESKMKALGYSEATLRKMVNGEYYFAGIQVDYQRFKDGVEMEDQKLDPVVEANRALLHERSQLAQGTELRVCQDIANRQQIGIKKYGFTVETNPLKLLEWMQHEYEEQLDAVVYKKRQIEELKRLINEQKKNDIQEKDLQKLFI